MRLLFYETWTRLRRNLRTHSALVFSDKHGFIRTFAPQKRNIIFNDCDDFLKKAIAQSIATST